VTPRDYYRAVLTVLALAGLVLGGAAAGPLRESFWGWHLWAFVPAAAGFAAALVVAAAWVLVLRRPAPEKAAVLPGRFPGVWVVAGVGAVVAAGLFWLLRTDHILLGDGVPLVMDLPRGLVFHERLPLTMWLEQHLFRATGGWFAAEGVDPQHVAQQTVALGSVIAGALFVMTAVWLARFLVAPGQRDSSLPWWVTAVLLLQGYMLLFFGYVENYAPYAVCIALYLLCALAYLEDRLPLWVVAVVFTLSLGLHLSTVGLLPSFLFLLVWGVARRRSRVDAVVGAVALVLMLIVLDRLLWMLSPSFTLLGGIEALMGVARGDSGGGAGFAYMFSLRHVRDFVNEQWLLGPLGAYLFVPGMAFAVARRQWRDPKAVFLAVAAGVFLAGSWALSDPLLGYPRDWDLFAPAAITYCAAGLYYLASATPPAATARLLAFATVLSLVSLVPWVWINHSEARTLERFATLPLGYGRTEVVIGNHYLRQRDLDTAEEWFQRALRVNPFNANAHWLIARAELARGNYEEAVRWVRSALVTRGDKFEFREMMIYLLLETERCDELERHVVWMAKRRPGDADYWHRIGDAMLSRECFEALEAAYGPVINYQMQLIAQHPDDATARMNVGIMLLRVKQIDAAIEQLEAALELAPGAAPALFNLGYALKWQGRSQEARTYFQQFLELHPDHRLADAAREMLDEIDAGE
jgi:tetratricopeptide (TPR) repeat protein